MKASPILVKRYGMNINMDRIKVMKRITMICNQYLNSNSANKQLVRFYYADKEDVFDAVSYPKGGRILNMLRHYFGNDAFYASLHKYLTDNKFKNGEAQQLRLAFESVTGQDLNWYWNEWYYGTGHPDFRY